MGELDPENEEVEEVDVRCRMDMAEVCVELEPDAGGGCGNEEGGGGRGGCGDGGGSGASRAR